MPRPACSASAILPPTSSYRQGRVWRGAAIVKFNVATINVILFVYQRSSALGNLAALACSQVYRWL